MPENLWPPERLRNVREGLNMGMDEFAKAVGVRRQTVWRWETGEVVPSPLAVQRIREKFQGVASVSEMTPATHSQPSSPDSPGTPCKPIA